MQTLQSQNLVVDAGKVDYQTQRLRIAPTGEFQSPEDIGDLAIAGVSTGRDELVRIRDFATVSFGYVDPPAQLLRHNGRQAIAWRHRPGLGTWSRSDRPSTGGSRNSWPRSARGNRRRTHLLAIRPGERIDSGLHGQPHRSRRHRVLALLALTMGWRAGIIIGISGLVFPILGTFIVMSIMGIDLHRISLGAMIVAMGMMVDNAIVVTDGIMVRVAAGMDRKKAAIEAASGPAWPLLGATVVACMAFYPIFASSYDTGEYAGSLFTVVAISLLLSWVFCANDQRRCCASPCCPPRNPAKPQTSPYQSSSIRVSAACSRGRSAFGCPFLASMVGLLVLSVVGFRFVPQLYFPDSSRLQVMIDYWAPEGTRIRQPGATCSGLRPTSRNTRPSPRRAPSLARARRGSTCRSVPKIPIPRMVN